MTSSSIEKEPAFSVRLVCAESYQTSPTPSLDPVYSDFRGSEIKYVPVIRIFGSTPNGEKTCVHVHGVFPYMYVPFTGGEDKDRYGYRLAASLDAAINVSLGSASAKNQHVFKVQLVSGMPLYGYHEKEHQFYKVFFYNPVMVKRAATLLQNGVVLNETLQPHEAHIPYIQQFMIDFNLHGMSMVELRRVGRRPSSEVVSGTISGTPPTRSPITSSLDYCSSRIPRQSTCKLEVDALASDIMNRQEIEGELALNPGLVAIWEEEKARRVCVGLSGGDSQLVNPKSPTRPAFEPTENDIYQRQRLAQRLSVISQSDESSMSIDTGKIRSSYPLETEENNDLMNASHLEHHVDPQSGTTDFVYRGRPGETTTDPFDLGSSLILSSSQSSNQSSIECSVLNAEDASLLEILNELADENALGSPVDGNSLLGSQRVDLDPGLEAEEREEEKEDESDDLNLTSLQLDSMSWSQRDNASEKQAGKESVSDYLSNLSVFELKTDSDSDEDPATGEKNIPQCDGPADFESTDDSDNPPEHDATLERHEKRVCDYRRGAREAKKDKVVEVETAQREFSNRGQESPRKSGPKPSPASSPRRAYPSPRKSHGSRSTPASSPRRLNSLNSTGSRQSRGYSPLTIIAFRSPEKKTRVRLVDRLEPVEETASSSGDVVKPIVESQDEEAVCNVTFTQFLQDQTLSRRDAESFSRRDTPPSPDGSGKDVVIAPKFNPPSFDRIADSMESYGIPTFRNETPFFGDHSDVMNRKEVAHQLLGVPSKSAVDLPPFKSDLEYVNGIKLLRAMKVREVYPSGLGVQKARIKQSLASRSKTVIEPLKKPPIPSSVKIKTQTRNRWVDGTGEAKNVDEGAGNPGSVNSPVIRGSAENNETQNSTLNSDALASRRLGISCGQIEGSSQAERYKIPCSDNLQDIKPLANYQYLTVLCLEIHVATRSDLLPDPQYDAVRAIFYAIYNDAPTKSESGSFSHGVITYDPLFDCSKQPSGYLEKSGVTCTVSYAPNEMAIFDSFLSVIAEADPDILIGWELESLSWGYLFQRAANLGVNLAPKVSRIPCIQRAWEAQTNELSILTEIKMPGRIVLDIWRIMRYEIALQSYTFENVMYHVMHQRLSCPSFSTLTSWWERRTPRARSMVVEHYVTKVVGILKLIHQLDIIGKTTEFARLYGIQFFEVFSRGSQFQVESVMLRLAKPFNYVPVSPSQQQRATMRAPESLPLIMEPESVFYSDPLIVLDFQSLYPSIVIAHNYCFSTCLGRVENIGQSVPFEFGATSLKVPKHTAVKLEDKMNFSPSGVAFVKPEVRVGILPRMLTEYLDTRLMVKKAMKDHSQSSRALQRALDSRQRGLKLLANVTFGYTHANFSGRMPCIEIGDSIVSKARETLERAIKVVESTKRWNARVVYGDTDSLFVLLPGKSREDAFKVGAEIASVVTAANPKPMKLKLEKIMQPSILQTKKRYCGYMYETPNQEKPVYLAKGIETVRRDGCPAVSKILEKSLRILFDTKDVSQVKSYVTRQLDRIIRGRASIQDLIFAKEFRGLQGYKSTACVPALELTRRLILKDPRAVPRTSERVPYIIVAGAPNQPLFQCVRSPWEVIADPGLRPNALYYTTRVIIPPLNRCFNLLGVDVNAWFEEMPHRRRINYNPGGVTGREVQKSTISQYFGTVDCAVCGQASNTGICTECSAIPNRTVVILHEKIRQIERSCCNVTTICQSCTGRAGDIECASLDCPVLYRRVLAIRDKHQISYTKRLIDKGNNLEL